MIRKPKPPAFAVSSTNALAMGLLALATFLVFMRPPDLIVDYDNDWGGWPLLRYTMIAAMILTLKPLQSMLRLNMLKQQTMALCLVGLYCAAILSHLSHMYRWGVVDAAISVFIPASYFLLVTVVVDTPLRLQRYLIALNLSALAMITLSVADYVEFIDFEMIKHVLEWDEVADRTGTVSKITRMCGPGIFRDPNDLAQIIMMASVLSGYLFTQKQYGSKRILWILPFFILVPALFMTRSRGGLMACGVAGLVYAATRFGGRIAMIAMSAAMLAIPLIGGRQGNMDVGGGTGQERILIWRDGFEAIKNPNILFGVGYNMYSEYAGYVAHNSYLHTYVELGLFGGTCFFGMMFFAALGLYRMQSISRIQLPENVWRLRPFLAAMLAGMAMSMMSLSRCYEVPTYAMLGAVCAYLNLVAWQRKPPQPLTWWDRRHAVLLLFCSAGMFTLLFLMVKVLAR